jgi:hypothetical protein
MMQIARVADASSSSRWVEVSAAELCCPEMAGVRLHMKGVAVGHRCHDLLERVTRATLRGSAPQSRISFTTARLDVAAARARATAAVRTHL